MLTIRFVFLLRHLLFVEVSFLKYSRFLPSISSFLPTLMFYIVPSKASVDQGCGKVRKLVPCRVYGISPTAAFCRLFQSTGRSSPRLLSQYIGLNGNCVPLIDHHCVLAKDSQYKKLILNLT